MSKESTSEDWECFITRWDAYKTATRIADHDATLQLLECCEDSLRKDLHRSHSNIAMATEIDALTAIKTLAVKAENAMVSRMTLLTMTRDRGEGVRSFAARLRGQAKVCKFSKNCSHNPFEAVDYTDLIRDALIRGLSDNDIQQDVLGHNDQDKILEDTIKFIEVKEAGKRSQATLQNPSVATVFSYKQTDKDQHVVKCRNCGKPGHRRRFPGHYLTIGSCPGYTRILTIQGWTQHSGWSDFIQQQVCYPITTKRTNPRHTAFCSSRCLLHDVQG